MNSKGKIAVGNENQHLSTEIELQQQKIAHNELRIGQLNTRKEQLASENLELSNKIKVVRENISKQQERDNPVVKQLREHFKAMREQLKNMAVEEDQGDDVDIDAMTYEELLQLGETIGKVSKGLKNSKFQALERFNYQNDLGLQEDCTICREEFEVEQECIRLDCIHFFHRECLKGWVQVEKTCPNCKAQIC